jgi:hypothetical protein
VSDGTTLTKDSLEVVRLNAATLALNVSEANLVMGLPTADAEEAGRLASVVDVARTEWEAAFGVVQDIIDRQGRP